MSCHDKTSQLDAVLPIVRDIVQEALKTGSAEQRRELELEVRFGTMRGDRFVPGVERRALDMAVERLSTNPGCTVTDWEEFEDYTFRLPPATDGSLPDEDAGASVRTRVRYDPYEFGISSEHTKKVKMRQVTLTTLDKTQALRISLNREVPVPSARIPSCVRTDHVRIQQRKTVLWSRDPQTRVAPWKYEFSAVWSGGTRSEADARKSAAGGPGDVHEFEIELVLASSYVDRRTPHHLAESLMLKALDFLDPHAILVVHTTPFSRAQRG